MDDPIGDGSERSMRLESFRVRGFRCFSDATTAFEPDVTVFVGRNDTGKSALLDAVYLYGRIARTGFRLLVDDVEIASYQDKPVLTATWRCSDTGRACEHTITCDPKHPRESLTTDHGETIWDPRSRMLTHDGQQYSAKGLRRLDSLAAVSRADWQAETDVPDDLVDALLLTRQLVTPRPYLFEPSWLARDVPLPVDDVLRNGGGWVILLQDMINRLDGSLEKLEGVLAGLFPHFRRVRVVEERYEVTRRVTNPYQDVLSSDDMGLPVEDEVLETYAKSRSVRSLRFGVACPQTQTLLPEERWVGAETVSAGLLLATAYLTVAMSRAERSLIAVEEPENGLNQVITLEMMRLFLQSVKERGHQLIMTTHNAFWLDLVGPDKIRVVTRNEQGSHVTADRANLQAILDEGFYLSEVMGLGGPEQLLEKRRG